MHLGCEAMNCSQEVSQQIPHCLPVPSPGDIIWMRRDVDFEKEPVLWDTAGKSICSELREDEVTKRVKMKNNRWWTGFGAKLRTWHFITSLRRSLRGVSGWRDNSAGILVPSPWQLSRGEAGPEAADTEHSHDASYNLVTLSFIQRGKLLWISIINIFVNFDNNIPINYD